MDDLIVTKTDRGFDYIEFDDDYGYKCSLQKSSVATRHCIWFGVNDPDPRIMAKDDPTTERNVGWVPFYIPDSVLVQTRMHLNREQVKKILPYLQRFAETGYLGA